MCFDRCKVRVLLAPSWPEKKIVFTRILDGWGIHSILLASFLSASFLASPNMLSRMTGIMIGIFGG